MAEDQNVPEDQASKGARRRRLMREYMRQKRLQNADRNRELCRKSRLKNGTKWNTARKAKRAADAAQRETDRARCQDYYQRNKDALREARRKRHAERPAASHESTRKWRAANPDALRLAQQAYRDANRDRINARIKGWRERNLQYRRERYASNVEFRLAHSLRAALAKALRSSGLRKSEPTFALVGCTRGELRLHLEAQFQPGMSWANYGKWHIDHRRPICTFTLADPAQQKIAFHFSNLRPLWAEENLSRPRKTWRKGN
jgi:hypothetical protein